jgi:hypothetical protein
MTERVLVGRRLWGGEGVHRPGRDTRQEGKG